ncbi:MAG: ATP-dependent helicase [Agathobacter sp.]|nr:ATP-dependent helicase [Agathobacter sp.]
MAYNKSQIQAIAHGTGPCMVLAGPGSGKTAVIIQRTIDLIEKSHVKPENILVITFTKAAATEMKQRFLHRMGAGQSGVTFGTFHGIFFTVLKYAYHYSAANIIGEEQRYALLRDVCHSMHLQYEDEAEFFSGIFAEISKVKNERIPLESYYSSLCGEEVFRDIFKAYQSRMQKNGLLDFDDMLVYTYELFTQRKDILAMWQQKFQYILIDEFQDINQLQYDIIRMLALPENNLFIVGDDDQSIYRFRGSKPEIMLHFGEDYKKAKKVVLDVNYRCTKDIVEKSLHLIGHNSNRYPKDIRANSEAEDGVTLCSFDNTAKEAAFIIEQIKKSIEKGQRYSDFAVLFRTNIQPQYLMEQLLSHNIPFHTKDALPNLYNHWMVRDILAYLTIGKGSRRRKDFLQILNKPKRYLSRESLTDEMVDFLEWEKLYEEQPWIAERVVKLSYDVKLLEKMSPYAAINYIRRGIGYEDYLREYATDHDRKPEELLDILDQIQESAKGFASVDKWVFHMKEYEEQLTRIARQKNANPNSVELATFHSAKGLEFANVFIMEVNESWVPYRKSVLERDIEEERRLLYVGLTRAKEKLWISYVKEIHNKSSEPSRFIKEIYGVEGD